MLTLVIAALVVLVVAPLIAARLNRKYGYASIVLVGMMLGWALLPRSFVDLVQVPEGAISDIAPPTLRITTQGLAIVGALLVIWFGRGRFYLPASLILFLLLITFSMVLVWGGTLAQWSGYWSLVGGVLAFGIGWAVGREVFLKSSTARFFLALILVILIVQLAVAALQLIGLDLPGWLVASDRTLEQTTGRVSGTIGHPANLSKVTFVLTLIALPFTASPDRRSQQLAWSVVALSTLLGGLTISRANLIATFVLLALWVLSFPGRARVGTRLAGAAALVVAAIAFAPSVLGRFEDDAEGGLRPVLLEAGLQRLRDDLWGGTGPNSYIEVVGQFDAATASGYPVHDAFLLLTAEVGLVASVCFFLPLLTLLVWSLTKFATGTRYFYVPRLVLYAAPGVIVVLTTGWGMISSVTIGLWMFAVGMLSSVRRGIPADEEAPASHGLRRETDYAA